MLRRIDSGLRRIRQDLSNLLDRSTVQRICRQVGRSWRAGVLCPYATLHWFLLQVLFGNTTVEHIARLAKKAFTDSAYCQARARLPLAVYQAILCALMKALIPETSNGRWHGHRTFLIDGSSFSMPDTHELQAQFGQSGGQAPGYGFPVAKILALFHAGTGLLLEVAAAPLRSQEMSSAEDVHPALHPGDVLVADHGFCSFAHLALLKRRGVHSVFRIHQRQIVDFAPNRGYVRSGAKSSSKGLSRSRWVRQHRPLDQIAEWFKPQSKPERMSVEDYAALPDVLKVRELSYKISRSGFRTRVETLVTTLLDAKVCTAAELAPLYGAH